MASKQRLDLQLLTRGLAVSRQQAQQLIRAGKVRDGAGQLLDKPGVEVSDDLELQVEQPPRFVSRGGEKLLAGLEAFPIVVDGRVCLDGGISTGGFTDCLLQHGAQFDARSDSGDTALLWAAIKNHVEIATVLLEAGADKEAKDSDGYTALHWAALQGHLGCARLLVEAMADVSKQNKEGKTALDVARRKGHAACVALLDPDAPALPPPQRFALERTVDGWQYGSGMDYTPPAAPTVVPPEALALSTICRAPSDATSEVDCIRSSQSRATGFSILSCVLRLSKRFPEYIIPALATSLRIVPSICFRKSGPSKSSIMHINASRAFPPSTPNKLMMAFFPAPVSENFETILFLTRSSADMVPNGKSPPLYYYIRERTYTETC